MSKIHNTVFPWEFFVAAALWVSNLATLGGPGAAPPPRKKKKKSEFQNQNLRHETK